MIYTYNRAPGVRKYKEYFQETLETALQEIQSKRMSRGKASRTFSIPLSTLSHKLRKKHTQTIKHPTVFNKNEKDAFIDHIQIMGKWRFPLSLIDITKMAQNYLNSIGRNKKMLKNNLPSNEWARKFLIVMKEKSEKRPVRTWNAPELNGVLILYKNTLKT